MAQVARNLLDTVAGFLLGKRFLILDRDPLYTHDFRAAVERAGGQPVPLLHRHYFLRSSVAATLTERKKLETQRQAPGQVRACIKR